MHLPRARTSTAYLSVEGLLLSQAKSPVLLCLLPLPPASLGASRTYADTPLHFTAKQHLAIIFCNFVSEQCCRSRPNHITVLLFAFCAPWWYCTVEVIA